MSWRCDRCGVAARFMEGYAPAGELPDGWAREQGQLVCLECRRRALIAAVDARNARGKLALKIVRERQRALVEFELRRADRGDTRIARTYRIGGKSIVLSAALVAEVSRQIERQPTSAATSRSAPGRTRGRGRS